MQSIKKIMLRRSVVVVVVAVTGAAKHINKHKNKYSKLK